MLHAEERRNRIKNLADVIETSLASNLEIDVEALVAGFCLKWGVARRTVLEYLKILEHALGFQIEKKKLKKIPRETKEDQQKQLINN